MTMLRDKKWNPGYTTDAGNLSEQFYIPALSEAVRYDRGTAYFRARSLVRNMLGIEGLIRKKGKMRMLVGCTLEADEIDAIRRGEDLKKQVENNLRRIQLDPPDSDTADGLELLSWMIASGYLVIRIAVRCGEDGRPEAGTALFHKKIGTVEDPSGDKISWKGSDNETPSGQSANSESMMVCTSWEEPKYQLWIEDEFENDWCGRNRRLAIMDVPEAVRRKLLSYAPPNGRRPRWLRKRSPEADAGRNAVWSFIGRAHKAKNGGMVGLATAPVVPWPHQVQVFRRLQANRPSRLLIADEVGLGKTIQAGLFLRQAWLEGRRRILVMAPAGVIRQWQMELREKLNLDWPVYDGKNLVWQDTHGGGTDRRERVGDWTAQGPVIVSSHLARRDDRASDITAAEWDVVVLDEAHYARQTNPNDPRRHTPNKMLAFMRRLQGRTADLVMMTATPMQLHPVELYDLLTLLGVPDGWNRGTFERFYSCVHGWDAEDLEFLASMFRASVGKYGSIDGSSLGMPRLQFKKVLRVLDGDSKIMLQTRDRRAIERVLLAGSPVARLVSRNTREQLREHIRANNLGWRLGTRDVQDRFLDMSGEERAAYDAVNAYISSIWNKYRGKNRQAVGFALTVYRKRLASSFAALRATLKNHLKQLSGDVPSQSLYDDEYDDMDAEEIAENETKALRELDRQAVQNLLGMIRNLPLDTKFGHLVEEIIAMRRDGYEQVMVYTQFTDTMDFLREELKHRWRILCYSGRHGEEPGPGGIWVPLTREQTKTKFRDGSVDILLCTDAAAEGLNFQFCGAMINYDMPWNPMRVEQRIGRIDRIGQQFQQIRIANMYYKNTVEADVYGVLRKRIGLFKKTIGSLQRIIALIDGKYKNIVLQSGRMTDAEAEQMLTEANESPGLDMDAMLASDTALYEEPESPVTMEDLDRIATTANLMHPRKVEQVKTGQYNLKPLGGRSVRITTDRGQFENHADSMEFWSPGSPAFPESPVEHDPPKHDALRQLLDSM